MASILIGMSGGVDSAVAASILKRGAHDVVGVTLLFDSSERSRIGAEIAAGIAGKLGIEHRVIDATERYEEYAAAHVVCQVREGREPSLDAAFTSKLLIPLLFEIADESKIRKVATGHYAGTVMESAGIGAYPWRLMRAHDKFNDQSFMLYDLSQDELNRLEFPLVDMQEMKVRVEAMREGLMIPQVPQGEHLYLYGEGSDSLSSWLGAHGVNMEPGDAIELSSAAVLGTHEGLCRYSVGDKLVFDNPRAGEPVVSAALLQAAASAGEDGEVQAGALEAQAVEPDTIERFVVAKDSKLNCLFVGSAAQAASESCVLENVTWTSIHPLEEKRSCRVRFARGDNPRPCQLVPIEDGKLMMSFTMPVAGLASGKTAVFYSDDMVLGGGTIA